MLSPLVVYRGGGTLADSTELTGYIVMKNDEQQIAYAAVLVPGEPDGDFARGEKLLTEKEIERVAHKWMMSYRNVDIQHTLKNVASPVESYILPERRVVTVKGKQVILPRGSWVMASKVNDAITWAGVKSGALTGYSVMGVAGTSAKALKSAGNAAYKRTLIADLGEDWYAPFVSFVDEPCVPKAKFFALKAAKQGDIDLDVPEVIVPAEKAGRSFSEDTFSVLRGMYDSLKGLITRAESERITLDSPVPVAEQNTITLTAEEVLYDNKVPEVDILTDISFDEYQIVGKADEDERLDVIGQIALEQFYAVQKGGEGSGVRGHTTDRSGSGSIPSLNPKLVKDGYSETQSKAAQAQGIKRGDIVTGHGDYQGLKDGENSFAKITGPVVGFGRYDWVAIDVDGTQYINSINSLKLDLTPEYKAEMSRQMDHPSLRLDPVETHYNKFAQAWERELRGKKSSESTVDERLDVIGQITLEQFYAVQKGGPGSGKTGHVTPAIVAAQAAAQARLAAGRQLALVNAAAAQAKNNAARQAVPVSKPAPLSKAPATTAKPTTATPAKPATTAPAKPAPAKPKDFGAQALQEAKDAEDRKRKAAAQFLGKPAAKPAKPTPKEIYQKVANAGKKSSESTVDEAVDTAEALTSEKEIENMTPEELKTVIETAVKSAIDPLTERLDALDQTVSAKAEMADVTAKEDALTTEIATLKSAIETTKSDITAAKSEVVEQVTKSIENLAGKPASKAIQIADIIKPTPTKTADADRDDFGRKIRKA
jgi:hypothetical protein